MQQGLKNLRVAIIGAGPGGLTLARLLQQQQCAVSVYERDADALARPQGGTLDLHPDSGQLAIRRAGLDAEFAKIARYQDQETRLYDKTGALLYEDADAADRARPEVDRGALRDMLLAALAPGVVRWGAKFKAATPRADGRYHVGCADGGGEEVDLVIGADGAWSRVRPLLCAAEPVYTGVSFIEMGIDEADLRQPELAKLVGHGTLFALGDGKGLIAQRNDRAHIRVYAALRVASDWHGAAAPGEVAPLAARASLATHFAGWAPALLQLILRSSGMPLTRPLYALPVGLRWENRPGLTLIGDAAHVMSPFTGQGVNHAMLDAADLAQCLAESDDWRAAVRRYETAMFERARQAAGDAAGALDDFMSPDAARMTLQHMRERA